MNRIARPRDPIRDEMLAVLDARLRKLGQGGVSKAEPAGRTGAAAGRAYLSGTLTSGGVAMVTGGIVSAEGIWLSVRREAEAAMASDPVLGSSLSLAILDHPGLGGALAFQIGQRLGTGNADRAQFTRIANEAFQATPNLVDAASRDLHWIVLHDPASKRLLPPLLNFKGYVALQAWRVANWVWRQGRTDLALLLQSASSEQLQVSIHPSASIGTSVFLDHATGIIVGSSVSIGDEVTIQQNVTVGRKETLPGRAPRVGRGVLLSTGATILGDLSIGDFAKIGAGSVVTHDVPAGCTAVGVPARLTNCPETGFRPECRGLPALPHGCSTQ